jgi:hypothetical protein
MLTSTETDVAQSMMRLWGGRAAILAAEYAANHQRQSNHGEAAQWQSVQDTIVRIRNIWARAANNAAATKARVS